MNVRTNRRAVILEQLKNKGSITVAELCDEFQVSDMTVRRDLADMEKGGLLRRVHGGAVLGIGRSYEQAFVARSNHVPHLKEAIGRKAAELIVEGDSIAFDTGTTVLAVAKSLADKRNITVITSSLSIANTIASSYNLENQIRLILTGGIVRAGELSMIGHFSEQLYKQVNVDKAFIGVAGIDIQSGITEYNLDDAMVKRAMIASAKQKIVVANASKFGNTMFTTVAALQDIDTIVTSHDAPQEYVEQLEAIGIEVIIASP
jgi:DeoR/GlpR family transcriptional regulator of sugar metabolism